MIQKGTIWHKIVAVLLIITASMCNGYAQRNKVIDPKGDELFKARCYEKATMQYLKTFAKSASNKANPQMLKRITESILSSEMVRDTARYFADLYLEFAPEDIEAYLLAARAHYHAHDFDIALQRLDSFMIRAETEEQLQMAEILNSWIRNGKRLFKKTGKNLLINVGEEINTINNEVNPFIINDDETLVFSCDDKFDREAIINVYNIKVADRSGLQWTKARKVPGGINTPNDEYPSGTTPNGMFFCSNKTGDFSLYEAKYGGNGRFTDITKFEDPIDLRGSEVAACYSPSGDTMYFSGTTLNGKLDIFYSIRTMDGKWREARQIPGLVNRDNSDENYPVLARGGTRLYFASDREGTMGGYDLFYSDFDFKRYEWGKPVQLPYPFNDTYDNMTISFSTDERYAYLSLIRPEGYGGRDIYVMLNENIPPTSAIIRYAVKQKGKDKKYANLKEDPHIEVRSESGELVALQKMNMTNSTFLVILSPGKYTIKIDTTDNLHYEEVLEIQEQTYNTKVIEKEIKLN